jgi:hypothetical protein
MSPFFSSTIGKPTAMSSWFKKKKFTSAPLCQKTPQTIKTVITTFTYDSATVPVIDSIPFETLFGTDQLVIAGTTIVPNTLINMPPHTALLELFRRSELDATFSIIVANTTANSVDLTIADPVRVATIPALSVVELFYRIINPTATTGVADVKLQVMAPIGGTASQSPPQQMYDMSQINNSLSTAGDVFVLPQNIWPGGCGIPQQLTFTTSTNPNNVRFAGMGDGTILFTNANILDSPLISGLVAGQAFSVTIIAHNQTGAALNWKLEVGATGTATYYAPVPALGGAAPLFTLAQPDGASYQFTIRLVIAGVSPFATTIAGVGIKELTP